MLIKTKIDSMKTSNRILLGFLILVFATPAFLFLGFRNKISKGVFTVIKLHEINNIDSSGSIKPFKILKVVGPRIEGVFFCHIIPANSANYDYNNFTQPESVNFQYKGDTLQVIYMCAGSVVNGNTTTNSYTHLNINLHLPYIKNIIVDGASIFIDSIHTTTNPEIYFDLRKNATLTLGGSGSSTIDSENNVEKVETNIHKSTTSSSVVIEKSTGQFNKVIIRASDSHVTFGTLAWIKDLDLQMQGLSKITVADESRIFQLSGFISNSVKVEANWKNIRRFATLTDSLKETRN